MTTQTPNMDAETSETPLFDAITNPRHRRFITAYLVTLNATEAANQAGYSGDRHALASTGWNLKNREDVGLAIGELLSRHVEAPRAMIVSELSALAQSNLLDYYVTCPIMGETRLKFPTELTREEAAAVAEVVDERVQGDDGNMLGTIKYKLHDKAGSLDKLSGIFGMKKQGGIVVEATGVDGGTVRVIMDKADEDY